MQGWIKLHRKLLDNWVASEPELLSLWIRLLIEANHSSSKKMFNGVMIEIKRGELIFGLEAFSAKSGISIGKLRRYLKLLEKDQMINRQKTNKYSVISIPCYDDYQLDDRQMTSKMQANDKQTTSKQQHYKNVKNDNNENNEKKEVKFDFKKSLMSLVNDESLVKDYMDIRRKNKLPNSERAFNGLKNQIDKSHLTYHQAINLCAEKGWKGFKAEWVTNQPVQQATQHNLNDIASLLNDT